ncbi:ArsR/SmtB family transcription factor [Mycobacterium tuberculosis]|uniref:ArsR/SmtB family transcription factor n=1 Tax=Mycobacterium tuberculosis TaxID=1773 RepID=UPI00350EC9F4
MLERAGLVKRTVLGRIHSVGELAAPFDISLAAASKHIKVLERAGLVKRTVLGRIHSGPWTHDTSGR